MHEFWKLLFMVILFFLKWFCIFLYIVNSLGIITNKKWEMGTKPGSMYHIFFVKMNTIKGTRTNIRILWHRSLMLTPIWFSSPSRQVWGFHISAPLAVRRGLMTRPGQCIVNSLDPVHFWTEAYVCWSQILPQPCLTHWLQRPRVPGVKLQDGGISVCLDHWVTL